MAYKVTVRYGQMGFVKDFDTELSGLRRSDRVVVRTDRGSESGVVVSGAFESSEGTGNGEVLRQMTGEDEKELRRIKEKAAPAELAYCRERAKELSLGMKIVEAEHLLGGEKIIFYFLAEGRVDFRQLVKDIARQHKTRIELRQIGVRDEARLLAEYGHCGQKLCCGSFMKTLEPVTMRMAKSQKATLDPSKISGVCGRLMCCLRYEDDLYRELKAKLPKKGSMLETAKGSGKVVDVDVLSQTLMIRTANSNMIRVQLSDIVGVEKQGDGRQGAKGNEGKKKAGEPEAKKEGESAASRQGASRQGPSGGRRRRRGRPSRGSDTGSAGSDKGSDKG